jgi:hypothetical protein
MPEASIDEDRYPPPRKDDVWSNDQAIERNPVILTEAKSGSVECGPQGDLGLGVLSAISQHGGSRSLR